jgi:uncharacterized LabA/DUF88 family protein
MDAGQAEGSDIGTDVLIVFIDYQNMYKGAREAFGWEQEPGYIGNFRPLALARALANSLGGDLKQVRAYTGVPHPEKNALGHAIMQRRLAAWKADDPSVVEIMDRTLRYPPPEGREKGVDVQLAVDFVRLAIEGSYKRAVLASCDTDLVPAVEFVTDTYEEIKVFTVGWKLSSGVAAEIAAPLDIPSRRVTRRVLPESFFERARDRTNHAKPAAATVDAPGQSGRRLPSSRRKR